MKKKVKNIYSLVQHKQQFITTYDSHMKHEKKENKSILQVI